MNQKVVFTLWRVSNVFYLLWDWYNTAFKPAEDQESESDCEESESDLSESESDDGVYLIYGGLDLQREESKTFMKWI